MKKHLSILIFLGSLFTAFAPIMSVQSVSIDTKKTVFFLERNRDANQILYKLNLDNKGNLDQEDPLTGYWVKHTQNGIVEPITWLQNEFAFGFKYTSISDDEAVFHFAPYDKKDLFLKKMNQGFEVFTFSNNQYVKVNRIMVHYKGGTQWLPNVHYVELFSTNVKNGASVLETIYP